MKLPYSSDKDEEIFQSHYHGSKSGVKFKYNKLKVFELFAKNYFKSTYIKLFMLE